MEKTNEDFVYDALSMPINIGGYYGMSRNSNGHNTIVVGKAEKCSEGKVTLYVLERKSSLYSDRPIAVQLPARRRISVLSSALFPINEDYIFNITQTN